MKFSLVVGLLRVEPQKTNNTFSNQPDRHHKKCPWLLFPSKLSGNVGESSMPLALRKCRNPRPSAHRFGGKDVEASPSPFGSHGRKGLSADTGQQRSELSTAHWKDLSSSLSHHSLSLDSSEHSWPFLLQNADVRLSVHRPLVSVISSRVGIRDCTRNSRRCCPACCTMWRTSRPKLLYAHSVFCPASITG